MNLRKLVAPVALSVGLFGSILAPVALANPVDQIDVIVNVTGGGTFDVSFCAESGATHVDLLPGDAYALTQQTAPTAATAGLATGELTVCYTDTKNDREAFDLQLSSGNFVLDTDASKTIAASNFQIKQTDAVVMTQSSTTVTGVGDITATAGTGPWLANNTLDTARTIHSGAAGIGTDSSYGDVQVDLIIPSGSIAGDYTAEVTITVIP